MKNVCKNFVKKNKSFFVNLLQNYFVPGIICSLQIFKISHLCQTITPTKDEDGSLLLSVLLMILENY
jgi:hypothetical protein